MKAFKCDVCGKYEEGEPGRFGGIKKYNKRAGKYNLLEESKELTEKDICTMCTGKILNFLSDKNKEIVPAGKAAAVNEDFEKAVQEMVAKPQKKTPAVIPESIKRQQPVEKEKKQKVDKSKVKELLRDGINQKEIAEQCHCSIQRVSQINAEYIQEELDGIDVGKVKALRAAGWKTNEIADEMRTSSNVIRNVLKE